MRKPLYNHILGSQDPDTGNKMYFISTLPVIIGYMAQLMSLSGVVLVRNGKSR